MRKVFTLFIYIISIQLQAQEGNIHTSFPLNNDANQRMVQESNFSFTAIALKSKEIRDFSSIGFINSADTIYFNNDLHSDNADGYFRSSLIHFEQAIKSIDLYIPSEVQDLNVVLINGSGEYSDFSPRKTIVNQSSDCELSGVVQQSEWRVGLPEPSYTRIFTDTGNMIVHHSAGSNNTIDFTQAVRDIYIYHTQENGWSDIGYNYLVAPTGIVYAGRDPAGGEQDQVMGAHFCGSNSNTMGICLMGNYETIEPTSELLESLESLISWKAFKDDLPVLESKFHPLNPELGVIAGHRDGCSTLCPGENVYLKLQEIRENVNSQLVICRDDNGGEDDGGEGDDDGGDGDGGEDDGGEGDDDGGDGDGDGGEDDGGEGDDDGGDGDGGEDDGGEGDDDGGDGDGGEDDGGEGDDDGGDGDGGEDDGGEGDDDGGDGDGGEDDGGEGDDDGGDGDGGEDDGGEGDDDEGEGDGGDDDGDEGDDNNEGDGDKNVEEPIVNLKLDSILNQKIYPNPLRGDYSFRLRIAESSKADLKFIRIFNQAGKQIEWENIYFSESRIEVKLPSSLKSGTYFLQISYSNGNESSHRFVVQ